jgi:hypothetical protein
MLIVMEVAKELLEYRNSPAEEIVINKLRDALAAYDKVGMTSIQTRKCPDCGEVLNLTANLEVWTCPYCGAKIPPPGPGVCRVCGCTDECGCPEGCWWVEPDLCSSCE